MGLLISIARDAPPARAFGALGSTANMYLLEQKNILPSTKSSGDLLPRTMPVNNTRKQSFAKIDIFKRNKHEN